ncbi:hypothetical protein CT0445 [Chlorobaculum tepidum TLS]|uniref:Uncharacterized protein n=1 Tax=Chlorobaculum tepidum (strain ATCC 49652 / DSM 12025 / NBRC 103806 / TLS) TaxID=194439 RepID=Q8KF84_CHLTE|nr:hypothetical protein CT0445 [Chlorobaculum tepidum TLS]
MSILYLAGHLFLHFQGKVMTFHHGIGVNIACGGTPPGVKVNLGFGSDDGNVFIFPGMGSDVIGNFKGLWKGIQAVGKAAGSVRAHPKEKCTLLEQGESHDKSGNEHPDAEPAQVRHAALQDSCQRIHAQTSPY